MTTLPLIYNAAAGGGQDISAQLTSHFRDLGTEVELLPTTGTGDATALAGRAAAANASRVVVAGGDGTINEVVNGLAGSDTELAVIPTGTANVLAIELEIPLEITRACELAVTGGGVAVDLGLVDGHYFILMAGIGFDALVIKNINPALKRAIRRAAFPLSGIGTFFREELPRLRIETDNHVTEGYFVIASNSRYYGGRFGPNPEASMADGLLDICVLKGKSLPEMINFWIGALMKGAIDKAVAETFLTNRVEITCDPDASVPIQTDGEVVGSLPAVITVEPLALRICTGGGR